METPVAGMEIKPPEDLQIKYKDKMLKICRPKVVYLREFKRKLKLAANPDSESSEVDVMYDYCIHVGVPEAILAEWDLSAMIQLFNYLNSEEKKS